MMHHHTQHRQQHDQQYRHNIVPSTSYVSQHSARVSSPRLENPNHTVIYAPNGNQAVVANGQRAASVADAGLGRRPEGTTHIGEAADYGPAWESVRPATLPRRESGDRYYEQEERRTALVRQQQERVGRPQSRGSASSVLSSDQVNKTAATKVNTATAPSMASLPPPPVLSAAQQGHLRQIICEREARERETRESRDRQVKDRGAAARVAGSTVRSSEVPHGYRQVQPGSSTGRGVVYTLPSPSLQQFQHPEQQLIHRQHSADARQHHQRLSSAHHAVASLPRYANLTVAAPAYQGGPAHLAPRAPSPLVPVYSTLSEAIIQQQEQQKQQQKQMQIHQHQLKQQHRAAALTQQQLAAYHHSQARPQQGGGSTAGNAAGHTRQAVTIPVAVTARGLPHEAGSTMTGNPHEVYNHRTREVVDPAPLRQQQQRAAVHHSHSLPDDQAPHVKYAAADRGTYETRASPGKHEAQQGRFFSGTATSMVPLHHHKQQPLPSPSQSTPSVRSGPERSTMVPDPATPVLVYAYPHGYVMAYPQGYAGTPQKAAVPQPLSSRGSQAAGWDPYECVSPSGEIPTKQHGFSRVKGDRAIEQKPPVISRQGSPVLKLTDPTRSTTHDDANPKQARSRASSNLSDVIERGFDDDSKEQAKPKSLPEPLQLQDMHRNVSPPETPLHGNINNENASGVIGSGDDKENARTVGVGVVGAGKKGGGLSESCVQQQGEKLSGKKRGGDEIAKQKSFSGSYFQVSPTSFLQPSKRRRFPSFDNNENSVNI